MKRMTGFILFWIAAGMLLGIVIPNIVIKILLMISFFLLGYNLFSSC